MADSTAATPTLGPGFRFHPTDEELVLYYLKRRVTGKPLRFDPISIIEIYKIEPWDLPGQSKLKTRDLEWYFFSALETKYGNGWRTNRATEKGYWKTTGKDRSVRHGERVVGMKKTLVFHVGRAPKGQRTEWVMHEYRLVEEELEKLGLKQSTFVLCRVFQKSGPGPKNGEQYGAPFVEEEWEGDDEVERGENGDDELKYLEYQNVGNGQDIVAEVTPLNGFLVGSDSGSGSNYSEDSTNFAEDQKVFIGNGESARLLLGEQILPEQVKIEEQRQVPEMLNDPAPVDNEFFEVEALLGATAPDSNRGDELVFEEQGDGYAPLDTPLFNDLQVANQNPAEYQYPFDMDQYLGYPDAGFMSYEDFSFDIPEVEGLLNQPTFTEEVNNSIGNAYMQFPGPSDMHFSEGSSSSEQKPEITKVMEDVKYYDSGSKSTFAKQMVNHILGAIPAPAALASDIPMESALGQNSTKHSSTTVHVTAGMIHISGTLRGAKIVHPVGKRGNALLQNDATMGAELTVMEPFSYIVSNKVGAAMVRSGYYFILFWVMILSISCKVGSYIYST